MAEIRLFGAELGSQAEVTTLGASASIVSSPTRGAWSSYALRCNPTSSTAGNATFGAITGEGLGNDSFASADLWAQIPFRFASGSGRLFKSNGPNIEIRLDGSAHLTFWFDNSQIGSAGSTTLSSGTYYRINAQLVSTDWKVWINGTLELSGADDLSANGNHTDITLGSSASSTFDYYFDDVIVSDTALDETKDYRIGWMSPDGTGTHNTWSIGAGAGSNWQNVDERPPDDDTTYLLSSLTVGEYETVTLSACPSVTDILAISAVAVVSRDGASNGEVTILIRDTSGDINAPGLNYTTTSSYVVLQHTLDTDPDTFVAWASTGVNAIEVGVGEYSAANASRCTTLGLMIAYTAGAGGGTTVPVLLYHLQSQGMA